jgi:hypothetical protein
MSCVGINNEYCISVLVSSNMELIKYLKLMDGFLLRYMFIKERIEYGWKNGFQNQTIYIKI